MSGRRSRGVPTVIQRKPLQTAKFAGILLALVFGVGGFFRLFDFGAVIGNPLLGDGQFLALVLVPLFSFGLVVVVFVETLVAGYRFVRSSEPVADRLTERIGYTLLRGLEAAVALAGVLLMVAAVPVLFAESTPAPAGVGILLLLLVVGFGILLASLVRSFAELVVYGESAAS